MKRIMPLAAVVVTALCALAMAGVASAQMPLPDQDPFYAVPAGISGLPNGAILKSRAVAVSTLGVPLPATAWQLQYKSLDNHNHPTAMVTTVMVPTAPWTGGGPRPVVSYQVAEDGADSKCAASYALDGGLASLETESNASTETPLIAAALWRGWAVVASDYEGPTSAFFAAPEEAHGVLDGIRAALAFKPAGFSPSTPVGMIGYSGGGYATSVAALFQPRYAPGLKLAGAAIGSPTEDVKAEVNAFSGTIGGGALAMAIAALNRAYPEWQLQQYLNAAGRQAIAASAHDCLVGAAARYPLARIQDWEAYPGAIDNPVLTSDLRSISPRYLPGHPTVPVFWYHDATDEFAPIGPAQETMANWCAAGTKVEIYVDPIGEHIAYESIGEPLALDYLAGRFAGGPAPTSCSPSPSPSPPLRELTLTRRSVHIDKHGRITLGVRNPNGFTVTLVGISLRSAGRSHRTVLRRTARVRIGSRRTRAIRLTVRTAALAGRPRLSVRLTLIERAPDGRTATSRLWILFVESKGR